MNMTRRRKGATIDIEGQPVHCIETDDGKRVRLVRLSEIQGACRTASGGFLRSHRSGDLALHRGRLDRVAAVRQGAVIIAVLAVRLSCSSEPPTQTAATHYEAHCAEHVPVFSSRGELPTRRRRKRPRCARASGTNSGLGRGEFRSRCSPNTDVSEFYTRAFASRAFGAAVEKCGGYETVDAAS